VSEPPTALENHSMEPAEEFIVPELAEAMVINDIEDDSEDNNTSWNEPINNDGPIDDRDDDAVPESEGPKKKGKWLKPPTKKQIQEALIDLEKLLQPPRVDKSQWYKDPAFDKKAIECLQAMKLLCFNVLDLDEKKAHPNDKVWTKVSIQTARSLGYSRSDSQNPGKNKSEHLC